MRKEAIIAESILLAQVASDGGKLLERSRHINPYVWEQGYDLKDSYIKKAINLICSSKTSIFRFKVVKSRGCADILVYFEAKVNGKKTQVSFHSFDKKGLGKFITGNDSMHIAWDEKDSFKSALYMKKHIK